MEEAKYRKAIVRIELGVSEHWADSGGRDAMIALIEQMMGMRTAHATGPGGATMHGLFIETYRPGSPDAAKAEELLDRMRKEYQLSGTLVQLEAQAPFNVTDRPVTADDLSRVHPTVQPDRAPDGAPWYAHLDGPCGPECHVPAKPIQPGEKRIHFDASHPLVDDGHPMPTTENTTVFDGDRIIEYPVLPETETVPFVDRGVDYMHGIAGMHEPPAYPEASLEYLEAEAEVWDLNGDCMLTACVIDHEKGTPHDFSTIAEKDAEGRGKRG